MPSVTKKSKKYKSAVHLGKRVIFVRNLLNKFIVRLFDLFLHVFSTFIFNIFTHLSNLKNTNLSFSG